MSTAPRFLWLFHEDLSSDIVLDEAKRLRLVYDVELGNRVTADTGYRVAEVSASKLGDLSGEDALRLRAACYARIGIDDPEAYETERLRQLPAYQAWELDRRRNPPAFRHRTARRAAA